MKIKVQDLLYMDKLMKLISWMNLFDGDSLNLIFIKEIIHG